MDRFAVGIIHNVIPLKILTQKETDIKAAELMDYMHNHFFVQSVTKGWLAHDFAGKKGEAKSYMRDRIDWLGVNYYTRLVIKGKMALLAKLAAGMPVLPEVIPGYGFACQPRSKSLDGLNAMKGYGKPLYATENGIADADDTLRPRFLVDHLRLLDRAINEERIDLREAIFTDP